jgi:hypothetical protein
VQPRDRFVDGAQVRGVCPIERGERPGLRAEPRVVPFRPRFLRGGESPAVPQEKLGEPMARAEQNPREWPGSSPAAFR